MFTRIEIDDKLRNAHRRRYVRVCTHTHVHKCAVVAVGSQFARVRDPGVAIMDECVYGRAGAEKVGRILTNSTSKRMSEFT